MHLNYHGPKFPQLLKAYTFIFYEQMYARYLNVLDNRSRETSCIKTLKFGQCGAAVYESW